MAFNICLLDELKELNGYTEGETFERQILGTMKDKTVLRIYRFVAESEILLEKLYEDNNFLSESLWFIKMKGRPESRIKLN